MTFDCEYFKSQEVPTGVAAAGQVVNMCPSRLDRFLWQSSGGLSAFLRDYIDDRMNVLWRSSTQGLLNIAKAGTQHWHLIFQARVMCSFLIANCPSNI